MIFFLQKVLQKNVWKSIVQLRKFQVQISLVLLDIKSTSVYYLLKICQMSRTIIKHFVLKVTFSTSPYYVINCTCIGRFDTSGTSKNDNFPKVLVGHGVKKYGIKIFLRGLQAEIWLFVYILQHFKKSTKKGIKIWKNNFWA